MDTIVLKFGGSSVADNIRLNVVAEKIISLKKQANHIVVVVSAQGKTTDKLVKEAQELSALPNEREMDALLATGEQITAAKLSILLNRMGQDAISLTGWQAGIRTSQIHKNAKIEEICTSRIQSELQNGKIVIVAGFQGFDEKADITTLGRGGSDTTAVALSTSLQADKCYIFSDVDGIYSADPNMITMAKRLDKISFGEMQEIADAGAKVLHNRCIRIGQKFDCEIMAKSTFSEVGGTTVCQKIESTEVKSIVKNDAMIKVEITGNSKQATESVKIYQKLLQENIMIEAFSNQSKENRIALTFRIKNTEKNKVLELLENYDSEKEVKLTMITKLSVIGYGITQDNTILSKIMTLVEGLNIMEINTTQAKIELITEEEITNQMVEKIHNELIGREG